MKIVYGKPYLKNLTVGSRIAFIRQLRKISRAELALQIGLSEKIAKRIMSRYEHSVKIPGKEKLQKIALVLDVNIKLIREYDLNDSQDLYYIMIWLEELYPDFSVSRHMIDHSDNDTQKYLSSKYTEWQEMKKRYEKGQITYEEYWDWKMK
ncbi:MAG: helix-turn-helix domain-containing protein [Lachnospiraceae bacterium]|nr:helix-turn-helix domain-containing protein [Lachnospiraceae bacterium]